MKPILKYYLVMSGFFLASAWTFLWVIPFFGMYAMCLLVGLFCLWVGLTESKTFGD